MFNSPDLDIKQVVTKTRIKNGYNLIINTT